MYRSHFYLYNSNFQNKSDQTNDSETEKSSQQRLSNQWDGTAGVFVESGVRHPQEAADDCRSVVSAAGTLFSEPWDSSNWESLLLDGAPPSTLNHNRSRKSAEKQRESNGID